MDYCSLSNELSYFVSREISNLCGDEEFALKSHEVLWKLSDLTEMEEIEKEKFFEECSLNSLELARKNHFEDTDSVYSDCYIKINVDYDEEEVQPIQEFINEEIPCNLAYSESKLSVDNHHVEKFEETKDSPVIYISSTSETSSCHGKNKRKGKSSREVEPTDFLSLKRKDVVFKSIFRMMRRYFCQLLEDNTDYNRKEKWINTKHKQLVKYISEGMERLGFNEFGKNMPFYFAAFAYPSDMRKILEESKQQFRTQNETISQAIFIVELIDNCFNRFSKKVLNDLLTIPQISFFINYYLSNVNDFSEYPKSFKSWYDVLLKSKEYVEKYGENSSSRNIKGGAFILKDEFFLFNKSESN